MQRAHCSVPCEGQGDVQRSVRIRKIKTKIIRSICGWRVASADLWKKRERNSVDGGWKHRWTRNNEQRLSHFSEKYSLLHWWFACKQKLTIPDVIFFKNHINFSPQKKLPNPSKNTTVFTWQLQNAFFVHKKTVFHKITLELVVYNDDKKTVFWISI